MRSYKDKRIPKANIITGMPNRYSKPRKKIKKQLTLPSTQDPFFVSC